MKKILTLFLILSFCTLLTGCFGQSKLEKDIEKNHQDLKNYPNPAVIIEKNDTNKDTKK